MKTPAPIIKQVEMTSADIEFAEKMANALGYTQTAYTSTSQLWGLYCLPDHATHKHGCIIKTKNLGFLFVADCEDLQLHDLHEQEPEFQADDETESESRLAEFGGLLAAQLKLRRDKEHKDRWQTEWGTKTNLGLARTILNLTKEFSHD